jgi:hypothetical protein
MDGDPTATGGNREALPPGLPGSRPMLSATQFSVLRRYGTEHPVSAGEVLFASG